MDHAWLFVAALGGVGNVVDVEPCSPRIRVQVRDPARVDEFGLRLPEVLAVVRSEDIVQIVIGPGADDIARELSAALTAPAPPKDVTVPRSSSSEDGQGIGVARGGQ